MFYLPCAFALPSGQINDLSRRSVLLDHRNAIQSALLGGVALRLRNLFPIGRFKPEVEEAVGTFKDFELAHLESLSASMKLLNEGLKKYRLLNCEIPEFQPTGFRNFLPP